MASSPLAKLVGRAPDYAELYGLLARAGRNVELATALLGELMRAWPDGREKRVELVDLEHENDAVTHDIVHHLHARPAVPFDRSDVLALASGLDDVVDYAEEAADFLGLYRVEAPMDQAIALADTLSAAGAEVAAAVHAIEDPDEALPHLREVKRLENDGRPAAARRPLSALRGRRGPDDGDPLEGHLRARRGGHRRLRPRGAPAARHRRQALLRGRLASEPRGGEQLPRGARRRSAGRRRRGPGRTALPRSRAISATTSSIGQGSL